jgi:hypothetical protein
MPILKDFRRTTMISLSKYEGSKIEIFDSLLAKDAFSVGEKKELGDNLAGLAKMIKSWNFTDEQEKPLPIALESLEILDVETLTELITKINEFATSVKKKD